MSSHRTGDLGVDGARRDYRGRVTPHELIQHVHGARTGSVNHMCPECGMRPRDLCPVCSGIGQVTTDQLHAYAFRNR